MDIYDLIESGRVKITCSKCRTKFKDKNGTCPNCGTSWSVGDAVRPTKEQPKLKRGEDPAKRSSSGEVREI